MSRFAFADCRRIVIKVGSSLLINADGELDHVWLSGLAADIAELKADGPDVIVVSSGAIAIGSKALGINKRHARLEDLQAAAAVGQVQLAHAWRESLAKEDILAAQVLLTPGDTENRRRFLNARSTLLRLLERKVVPVINENDTVATEEIRYGDNDRLAARVAQLVMADGLLLLSDVDGFYTADPGRDQAAVHIPEIRGISVELQAMAGTTRSDVGTGGMATKVEAARIATRAGCSTMIASGKVERPVRQLVNGARCSVFLAEGTPAAARKQWLAGSLAVRGRLLIDEGAVAALHRGGSLLPVGVRAVEGTFGRGDVLLIIAPNGTELGRGLAEYGHAEAAQIAGCQSDQIEQRLGYRGRSVMLHRDELVLFSSDE
jgi:glutamate 5-kinase